MINKNKKATPNKGLKVTVVVLLVLVLVLGATLVGVFARFAISHTGEDSARLAVLSPENTFAKFSLFSTEYDNGMVKSKNGDKIVAPGTSGKGEFIIDWSAAEVFYNVGLTFTAVNESNLPIEYSLNGIAWTADITTLNIAEWAQSTTYVLSWKWVGEDVPDGITEAQITVTVEATFTQATSEEYVEQYPQSPKAVDIKYAGYTAEIKGTTITLKNYTGNDADVVIPAPPAGMTLEIGYAAFNRNNTMQTITLPQGLTHIESYAVYLCESFKTITIPSSVKTIGGQAFAECTSLTEITFESVPVFKGAKVFYNCSSLETVTFNGTVNGGIGGDSNFEGCDALKSVTWDIPDFQDFGTGSFKGVNHNIELRFPQITKEVYEAKVVANSVSELGIEDGVTITVHLADGTVTLAK